MSEGMDVRNMTLKKGWELNVKGSAVSPAITFAINVGHSNELIGLHFNPRFLHHGDFRTIVMNTFKDGSWQEEQKEKEFPFEKEQEFEVTIVHNVDVFDIYLQNGKMVQFPNRLGSQEYKYFSFWGDARIQTITVRPSLKPTKR